MVNLRQNNKKKTAMEDYLKKINEKEEDSFVVQEPVTGMSVTQTQMSVRRHSTSRDVLEESMPCFFSEEELDEEIRMSMKSGNATQSEIDAVFCR